MEAAGKRSGRFFLTQPAAQCHKPLFATRAWLPKSCPCSCRVADSGSEVRPGPWGDTGRDNLSLFCRFSTLPSPDAAAGAAGAARSSRKLKRALREGNGVAGGIAQRGDGWQRVCSPRACGSGASRSSQALHPSAVPVPAGSPAWCHLSSIAHGRRSPSHRSSCAGVWGWKRSIVLKSALGDRQGAQSPLSCLYWGHPTASDALLGHHHRFVSTHPTTARV